MAGFIDKKKRLIDYKLTEFGREKLSKGSLNFEYFTFSDRSIIYSSNLSNDNDYYISNSFDNYLPFETSITGGEVINPEIILGDRLKYNDRLTSLYPAGLAKNTLSDNLKSQLIIDNKLIENKTNSKELLFDNINKKSIYDFKNNRFILEYPTVKYIVDNVNNLPKIKKDQRFSHFIKNQKLVPVNVNGSSVDLVLEENVNKLEFIFKNLEIEFLDISNLENRELIINEVTSVLEKDNKIFKLEYAFQQDEAKELDNYLFELHEVKNNNLEKLAFVNLGEFIDNKRQEQKVVYLIGKIVRSVSETERFNSENRTLYFEINEDYVFLNMFTMVIKQWIEI